LACWNRIENDFPVQWDWVIQDAAGSFPAFFADENPDAIAADLLGSVGVECPVPPGNLRAKLDVYVAACERRRAARLTPLVDQWPRIVFTKHYNLGGSHYAYTEGQSDAQHERHFHPGSSLCLLELEKDAAGAVRVVERTLLDDPNGVVRDPDVSYDGKRILFSWKKSELEDDYHLYEMDVASGSVRQLTTGLGFADYEGAYLPNGDIVFNSTRCVQTVDCWWTEVSNLYTCDRDGNHLRRLCFDQVHTNFPAVLPDGRVVYTRWEYSDRGQIYPQALFQMNYDGTKQTAFYGNNSFFPTTLLHARGIPGMQKVMAIATGHHTKQAGKLIVLDPAKGREENSGAQLIAPVRETEAVRVDRYGQEGDLFQYPYPLSETACVVAYHPYGWAVKDKNPRFKVYFMTADGQRELLASDDSISCNQPVPLAPRQRPHLRPSTVDYRQTTGTYYVHDVYAGPGLSGVPRGTIMRLRVVALDFRAAGIGDNRNKGVAGGALISTPPSIDNAAWDPKIVLGEARVHEDGSACFNVPARTPVYFQALDKDRHVVQTMRSWSTLQPGERFSCVGCHESPNTAPPVASKATAAMAAGPQELERFYGPARGFSFPKEIQPILDKHCIRCHKGLGHSRIKPTASRAYPDGSELALFDHAEPSSSNDHRIPRFSWWPHKGTREWVQYQLQLPTTVSGVSVYWFDDRQQGGRCRVPAEWRLRYHADGAWHEVVEPSGYGVQMDAYNDTHFRPVTTTALRLEVALQPGFSGGILEWRVDWDASEELRTPPFSLLGNVTVDPRAKRKWSDSYLALTQHGKSNALVNWVSTQSAPPMLPPYHAGAAKSGLLSMLREGHNDVSLSREELDKLACWIDLLVPYCGDYVEANAWTEEEKQVYERFLKKRHAMERIEGDNIEGMLASRE
jgi:hypothetical protein